MGTHTGPIRVYRVPRARLLASLLRPVAPLWLGLLTSGVVGFGLIFLALNVFIAIALAAVVVGLWATRWIARASESHVLITDRYHWEQVDKACDAIVRHLPAVSALGGDEVRSAVQSARWDLACLIRDQGRLTDLEQSTRRSASALATDDPLRGELEQRHTQLTEQLRSIQTEIDQRIARLQGLATRSNAVAKEDAERPRNRAAAKRARRILARADAGIAAAATRGTRADPAGDFTERAEAVLAAYQELRNAERPPRTD